MTTIGCSTSKKRKHSAQSCCMKYSYYTFDASSEQPPSLDRIDPTATSPQDFFRDYVSKRKPCILNSLIMPSPILTSQNLQDVAGNVKVQVERRQNTDMPFGQNRTPDKQIVMTINQLFELWKIPENRELYYLSTQQPDDEDDVDTESSSTDAFQGPTLELLKHGYLHETILLAGNLRLESCNLWMGMAANASSGLHHDYHDNIYLLVSGIKHFRLYAPSEHSVMETYGTLDCIHENGLISYQQEPLRSDGLPLRLLEERKAHGDDLEDSDDEASVVLGKGFEYQSSDDEDAFPENGKDDFDDHQAQEDEDDTDDGSNYTNRRRPDSFSAIDPTLPKRTLQRDFPAFTTAKECIVELQAGEALYIPASWFHCVTSSPGKEEPLHMAINYWYHPPDKLDTFQCPYMHAIWKAIEQV
ncbi:hypothetical protein MPSEU_001027200 [Mayamaea pseudoterrestris]|nr:hypothetical protein MPSEU_001027200 [Mayamaea pseudoterrestris]